MKRRDMKLLLEERFERIALLETRIDTMDQLVEGYRAREQSIFETLNTAKENAAKILEQARAEGAQLRAEAEAVLLEAGTIRANARTEAEALLEEAIHTANTLKAEAERKGVALSATVKADSERMLRDAEIIKREYEEMVDSFNAMLEQNASELEITAARFAEFVKNRKIDRTEARLDGNAFYKSVGELNDADLPDASGDPSLLMQNIYRIQNRPLPEDRQDSSAQESEVRPGEAAEVQAETQSDRGAETSPEFPMVDGSGADERQAAEPYSEAAWANEAQQSESEPQAEFTRVFDDAYRASEYTVQSDGCQVTQEDVESAFEAALTEKTAASVSIPAGSAILTGSAATEPLADAARAFDEYFDGAFKPGGKTAQNEMPRDRSEGPEGAQPEASKTAPEPYSEQAWSQSAFMSEHEPQAEGALFGDPNAYAPEPVQDGEPVTATEAESAFDEYLTQIGSFTPATPAPSSVPEPYSERAWSQNVFASEHEPQAEGALFGDPNAYAPEPVQDRKPVTANEAERALDDYLAQIGSFTQATPAPSTAPEPYSERAWSQNVFASEHEPQAEGALFGDTNAYAPEPVQDGKPVTANEAERALDDYLSQIGSFTPAASAPPAVPEPYSEQAWSQNAYTSEYEPQAEGASHLLAQEPDEEAETEPAPEQRRYSDYGEIREWEPEPEPEMEDIPTVSRFIGQTGGGDDISLDELLDEIIKAGD